MSKNKSTTVRLPADLRAELEALSVRYGISLSAVVNMTLRLGLVQHSDRTLS